MPNDWSGDTLQFHIDIADTGIGMSPEAANRIFEDFVQADVSTTRKFGGTGLGLSISRKFAKALGGDITVESEPGAGSIFRVSLDAGSAMEVAWVTPEQALAVSDAPRMQERADWVFPAAQILVVDDGPENREFVKVVLEDFGLTIHEAENGRIAVEMVTATDYDLILMDVQMPEMDGLTATKLMRDHGLQTPIIALSANVMKGFEQELYDAGYTDYLTKPIDLDRFMSKLAELLNAELKQEPFTETIMSESLIEEASSGEDTSPIVSRLGGNNKFAKVISRFVSRLEEQLPAMDEAFWAQDFESIAKLAHWLKGAGGTVGFDVFYEPASELESAAKAMDLSAIERQASTDSWVGGTSCYRRSACNSRSCPSVRLKDDIWPPQANIVKISITPQDSSENDRQEGSETAISGHLRCRKPLRPGQGMV